MPEYMRRKMNKSDAIQLWATLGAEGKAQPELTRAAHTLSSYTVGVEPWIDRLAGRYLNELCRQAAHFKLVLAPYGGGKTHFLLALGVRAREDNFAVAYVPCGEGASLDSPLGIYRELVKHLQLPGQDRPGLRVFLRTTVETKREEIERHDVPDVDAGFRLWVSTVRRDDYPENAFGRVMAAALTATDSDDESAVGEAALRWLQGDVDTLTKGEMQDLHLAKVPAASRNQFGRNLLLSLVRFLPEAKVHGLTLLMDEVETLFQKKGKAALRVLGAMRVILDAPTGVSGGLPLFGVFSATPEVLEEFRKYPALEQRLAVRGASFDEGNDFSPQLPLEKVQAQETMLAEIGERLVEVGDIATGMSFDRDLQRFNARRLAQVASTQSLDVNARLYVKTWVNVLNLQSSEGEREIDEEELARRYQGSFTSLEDSERRGEFEP